MEPTPEQQRDNALAELARLRAGLSAGLTVQQAAFLRGNTEEEIAADVRTLMAEFGVSTQRQPTGSGSDVQGSTDGSFNAGAERYRQKHGVDENGRRPEGARNPFQESNYRMEH
ncbi:hypothetical protein ABZX69_15960 [Streptomyces sp. NPDC004074]|uniref:hypothetical protein n=1 Tax=Streptomyces sp. NPDC004074 TaxID=3154277 RepID=UPI0033BE1F8B